MARKPSFYPRKNAGVQLSRPVLAALRFLHANQCLSDPVEAILWRWVNDHAHQLPPALQIHLRAMTLPATAHLPAIKADPEAVAQVVEAQGGHCVFCNGDPLSEYAHPKARFYATCPVCDNEGTMASQARLRLDKVERDLIEASKAGRAHMAKREAEHQANFQRLHGAAPTATPATTEPTEV